MTNSNKEQSNWNYALTKTISQNALFNVVTRLRLVDLTRARKLLRKHSSKTHNSAMNPAYSCLQNNQWRGERNMCNARGISLECRPGPAGRVLLHEQLRAELPRWNQRNRERSDGRGNVESVSVVATAVSTGVAYNTVSSNAGQFLFQDLPIGAYTVVVSGNGFRTVKVDNVPVSAGTIYTLQIKLTLAQTNSTVDVSADQIGLDTTAATLSTVLPTKAIQDVPSNGRDIISAGRPVAGICRL